MPNDTIQIHDVEKNEILVIELTDSEQIKLDEDRENAILEKQQRAEKAVQKEQTKLNLLTRLGLTEDEAKIILS